MNAYRLSFANGKANLFLILTIFLLALSHPAEAVRNPVAKGLIQAIPSTLPLKGIKVVAYDGKGKKITTSTNATGQFELIGLPFNSTLRITVENPNVIADARSVSTGSGYEEIRLGEPLRVLQLGPPGSDLWAIHNGKSISLNPTVFQRYDTTCTGKFPGAEVGRFGYIHRPEIDLTQLPVVTPESWIILNKKNVISAQYYLENHYPKEVALASITQREKVACEYTHDSCTVVIPGGWFVGIKNVSFGTYSNNYSTIPISVQENFIRPSFVTVGGYIAFKIGTVPAGRWGVVDAEWVNSSRHVMSVYLDRAGNREEVKIFAWLFEVK
ncbi:MAG: hypothetical protein Q7J31_05205 [Syntrophales bacterium]|nr:hypothetical protein [Syntrophales bacterium]